MRQYCAISIILFGYKLFLQRKYFRYFLIVFIASFIHSSALICLILPMVNFVKLTKKIYYLYFIVIIGIVLFSNQFLSFSVHYLAPQYERYISSSMYGLQSRLKIGSLLNLFIGLVLLICFYSNYQEKNEIYTKLLKIFMIGLVFTAASVKFTQIGRISSYFTPTAFILISMCKKNKLFYITLLTLFSYCIIVNYFRPEWTGFFPYYFDF